jgi:hypothetical protein
MISYDAFESEVIYEANGRRSKKKEKQYLEKLCEAADQIASRLVGRVLWDKPLRDARIG